MSNRTTCDSYVAMDVGHPWAMMLESNIKMFRLATDVLMYFEVVVILVVHHFRV